MLGIDYIDSNSKPLMLVGNVNILSVDDDIMNQTVNRHNIESIVLDKYGIL